MQPSSEHEWLTIKGKSVRGSTEDMASQPLKPSQPDPFTPFHSSFSAPSPILHYAPPVLFLLSSFSLLSLPFLHRLLFLFFLSFFYLMI